MDLVEALETSFMSNIGNYYHNVIPFGLKNVSATYQILMNAMFSKQIGCILKVYIDDIIVKTS